jgi:hypothetical protein
MRLRSVISVLATALLLFVLSRFVDVGSVVSTLGHISLEFLALAVIGAALNVAVSCLRYQRIQMRISGTEMSLLEITKINLLSLFCVYFLPVSAAADGVRVVAAIHRLEIPTLQALEGVVHDRILAAVGLMLCVLLSVPLQLVYGIEHVIVIPQLVIATALLAIWPALDWLGRLRIFPAWSLPTIRTLTRSPMHVADARSALCQVTFAIASSLSFALSLFWLARGMSIDLALTTAIVFAPALYFSQVVPFFYGGFGAREAVSIVILAGSGVMSAETAVSLSLAVGICNLLVSLPGALVGVAYISGGRSRS